MREVLKAEDARFLLLLGDQIYSDGIPNLNVKKLTDSGSLDPAHLTEHYRQLYRGYFNEAGFRSILELVPSYMIWDDHDILDNWGSFPHWITRDLSPSPVILSVRPLPLPPRHIWNISICTIRVPRSEISLPSATASGMPTWGFWCWT
jgi:PhoD-like phosphatase